MSIHTLQQRVTALESRLADIEGGYGQTLYRLERRAVRAELDLGKILSHLGATPTTEEEIDQRLDES